MKVAIWGDRAVKDQFGTLDFINVLRPALITAVEDIGKTTQLEHCIQFWSVFLQSEGSDMPITVQATLSSFQRFRRAGMSYPLCFRTFSKGRVRARSSSTIGTNCMGRKRDEILLSEYWELKRL